ncbi:MAG: DNA-3-methyladenine glycosylase [Candidatus Baltobacteraceae bacterium]
MKTSVFACGLPVRTPYRLDLTADALRRLSANIVDRFEDGEFIRALEDAQGHAIVRVRQDAQDRLSVRIEGKDGERFVRTLQEMLGTQVDLRPWYRNVRSVPWLNDLARDLRGVKPPRYPTLWEGLCHSIIFQQISIHAAGAIMHRVIERFARSIVASNGRLYPFPHPEILAAASVENLRACGLSVNKVTALKSVAAALLEGRLDPVALREMPTPQAVVALCELRGIGPWSAAVVLLRGLGRLDVFPLKDSGVAASLKALSGNQVMDVDRLLDTLGEQRGMLYFHLLLGRIAQRRAAAASPATRNGL